MHEDRGPGPAHVLGDGLGGRTRLAEKEALLPLGNPCGVAGDSDQIGPVDDQQLTPRRLLRAGRPRCRRAAEVPCSQRQDRLRVAHGRAQPDALDIVPREPRQALEDAHEVRAAVGAGEGVDLVDDHHAQVARRACARRPAARPASPPATRAWSSAGRPARPESGAAHGLAVSPCQTKRRSPTISV